MSGNAQKTPITRALNKVAQNRVVDWSAVAGKRLPVSVTAVTGAIVEVKFEVVSNYTLPKIKVPIANSLYVREPTQIGDKGWVQAADARIGYVSGLADAPGDLSMPGNLGALVFEPIGNANWDASPDPDALLLQGPNGVIIRDIGANCTVVLDQENITVTGKTQILVQVGNNASIKIVDGEIDITATTLKLNGKVWETHEHSGVQTGGGNTGGVV